MMKCAFTSIPLLALGALLASAQTPAPNVALAVRDDSKLWVEGTSNLHEWSCKATTIDASISVDDTWQSAVATSMPDVAKLMRRVAVKIPVTSLKCGKDKMDKLMYEALKAKEADAVSYIAGTFDATPGETKDSFIVHTTGTLRIAGKENPVSMDVRAERLPDGTVRAQSELPILMTDYGVKPPTALFGTLRTGNKVTVKFELFVGPNTLVAATSGTQR